MKHIAVRSRLLASHAISVGLVLLALACTSAPQTGAEGPGTVLPPAATEWERTVAAAKQEGSLVILGPPGADARDGLVDGFQRTYPEINVELDGASGAQHAPKLFNERGAGVFRADLYMGGTTTAISDLAPVGALDPIQPFLVGPEVQDASAWTGGRFDFADDAATYALVFATNVKVPLAYNPQMVSPTDLKSWWDLLDPKWRGKIVMRDPRTAGPGLSTATHLYTTDGLGKAYLEQLFASGVVFSTDDRQMLDWVARGQYAIAIAHSDLLTAELKDRGIVIESLPADAMREGSYLTPGFSSIALMNQAPHPNAAKVYLNWLLSRGGQTDWSKASGYASRRLDVPREHLPAFAIPKPGVLLQENYKEPYVRVRDELEKFLKTAIPS